MKSTIIFLGLVALTLTTTNAANEWKSQDLDQQELTTLNVAETQNGSQLAFVNQVTLSSVTENNSTEEGIFNPSSVITTSNVKTAEELIAENILIIESQEESIQPLYNVTTIEDRIAEDNQIIESTISNEVYLLDFEKINSAFKSVKINNNAIITADLKL